jgi:hypothetical protein
MKMFSSIRTQTILCLSLWAALAGEGRGQVFTIQVGAPPAPSAPLINHSDTWHYRPGLNNAPQADWTTADDTALDGTWTAAPGGFGYGDAGIVGEATTLSTMMNNYSSLFIRRSFSIAAPVDPSQHIQLTVDYDDGYVAYLDGIEIARSPNVTGTPAYNASTVTANHEASCCNAPVNPPTVLDLGLVGSSLPVGSHVLALQGINGGSNSSDFHLIVDLGLTAGAGASIISGPLLSIVNTNSVMLSGSNTIGGTSRVTINGADTIFDTETGAWSKQQSLNPGCNRLIVEAVAANGAVIFSTNQTVVSEITTTTITSLAGNTVFDSSMGVIRVPNTLTVPGGGSLTINPGTVLLLGAGVNLHAAASAAITINGTRDNPVCLFTADGLTMWGELAADGANSFLTVHHVESIGGAVKGRNGATCLLEDSYFHDYKNGTVPIGGCTSAQSMTVRRCHFRIYHETLWQDTLMTVEENLFELANNPSSDALDFDGAKVGSVIRRCTFRHGPQSNTDAIDIGPTTSGSGSTNTIIEDNVMFDFPNDKGVSIGEGSYGIVVRNCLMYGNDSGVAVKDSPGGKPPCTANVYNCTIVDCDYGFRCYNKSNPGSLTDGGRITNSYNNIIWGSRIATFEILNSGIVVADHSDFGGTNWPGEGNLDFDPLFVNPAGRDYQLTPNSPCIGTGRDSANMGAHFPVGAPMAPSHPYFTSISVINDAVELSFWVDSEKNYTVQGSETAAPGSWTKVADVYHQMVPRLAKVTSPLATNHRFYRLVTPVQP